MISQLMAQGWQVWLGSVEHAAVNLVWLAVMFGPLERAFPARRGQAFLRRGFWTDLAFFLGQYWLFAALAGVLLKSFFSIFSWVWIGEARAAFATIPFLFQVLVVMMCGDLVGYWGHRLQHRVDLLWRFHSVHHSSEDLDWLAAHREHPLDGLYTQMMVNLPAFLLGFSISEVMALVTFRGMWAVFIHANVRLNLGWGKFLFGAPILHHWHHARDRDVGNYANLAPWLDLLFGTYHCPEEEPESLGLSEPIPKSYMGLLLHPLRRQGERDDR